MRVEIDSAQLSRIKALLGDLAEEAPKVLTRSINKTLGNCLTYTSKITRETYKIKAKRIKQDQTIQRATFSAPQGYLRFKSKRISLMSFGAKQLKAGVSYQIKKKGGRKKIEGAFIAPGRNANMLVFVRKNRKGGKPKPRTNYAALPRDLRYPIIHKRGPSVATMVEENLPKIEQYNGERMEFNVNAEVETVFRRHKG